MTKVFGALVLSWPILMIGAQVPLEVRHVRIGMTPAEVEAAALAGGMHKNSAPGKAFTEYLDPKASGRPVGEDSGSGGHGLVLDVSFEDGKASLIVIKEQGDTTGEVGRDLTKKWGQQNSQYSNPGRTGLPWWGDPKGVWAEFQSEPYGFDGCNVTIHGPAKARKPRQGVPM